MNLVTGATGIVGAHLVAAMLQENFRVRVLVRSQSDTSALKKLCEAEGVSFTDIELVYGDILDPISLRNAIDGCQEVYHAAALVSFNPKDRNALYEVNVEGTANVVNACLELKIEKLCYISSTAAIGDQPIDGKLTEDSAWSSDKGRSEYSLSKRYAEMEALRGREEGLHTMIVNPSVVIGPGKWGESSTSLFVSSRNGMRFYPSGSNGFVDAKDIAGFCLQGMKEAWFNQRYLLVGENLSFFDLFSMITTEMGSTPPSIRIPKPLARIGNRALKSLEFFGLNVFSVTSHNIDSAYKKVVYANQNAREKGFTFTPISDAIRRTVAAYNRR